MLASWGASRWFLINVTHVGEYSALAQVVSGEIRVLWFPGWARHWPGPGWHIDGRRCAPAWSWKVGWGAELGTSHVTVPLYIPFALSALPTAFLFYRDRRSVRWAREGRCVWCGYDLSGVRGPCPECGKAVRA
jgi:hypothetical protein